MTEKNRSDGLTEKDPDQTGGGPTRQEQLSKKDPEPRTAAYHRFAVSVLWALPASRRAVPGAASARRSRDGHVRVPD